jgi:cytochrome c-type biogenesis protein CcmE
VDKRTKKLIIAVVFIGLATAYLLYQAVQSSWVYYYSVDEFVNGGQSQIEGNRAVRLAGWVKDNSIINNAEKMQLDFELAAQKSSIAVRYHGFVPKNFAAGKEVVVEGKIGEDKIFLADNILTKCESKYKIKLSN